MGIKGRSAAKNIRVHEKCKNRVYIYIRTSVKTTIYENIQMTYLYSGPGRAIAQAVSRWLPTAAARVQTRV
jgi:hypothetical protein